MFSEPFGITYVLIISTSLLHCDDYAHHHICYLLFFSPRTICICVYFHDVVKILLLILSQTPAGWSSLEYQLPSIKSKLGTDNVKYIFPHAPTVEISINGGAGKYHTMYDIHY